MSVGSEIASYRTIAVEGASPIEISIMLCDVLVRDLKQVVEAIHGHRIEERVRYSNHAFQVLQELEQMLNFHEGGQTARDLEKVYCWVRAKLLEAQIKLQPTIVEKQIEYIQELRQAWKKAFTALTQARPIAPSKLPAADAFGAMDGTVGGSSWSA
jgi:flagellar secretion chaperone FliS